MTREEFIGRAADALMRRSFIDPGDASAGVISGYVEQAEAVLEAVGAWSLQVTLETVRDLHRPVSSGAYCVLCDEMVEPDYPCSTVRAVRLVLGGI